MTVEISLVDSIGVMELIPEEEMEEAGEVTPESVAVMVEAEFWPMQLSSELG